MSLLLRNGREWGHINQAGFLFHLGELRDELLRLYKKDFLTTLEYSIRVFLEQLKISG